MTLLAYNSTPAERAAGCVFAENFESFWHILENGGVVTGTPSLSSEPASPYIDLDGTDDYVRYFDLPKYNLVSKPFTLSLWYRSGPHLGAGYQRLIDKFQSGTGNGWGLDTYIGGLRMIGSTSLTKTYAANLTVGTWYHLAAKSDGAGNGELYQNGASLGSGSYASANVWTGTINVGTSSAGTSDLSGALKQLRIFNCELSDSDIEALYHEGNTP